MRKAIPLNAPRSVPVDMRGGEDLISSAFEINPGRLLFSENYETDKKGHPRRIDGFERFDGQPKPSEASYWVLNFDAGSTEIAVEDIVTGATSVTVGEVLIVSVSTGSWATNDAAGYLVLFNVASPGAYQDNEDLEVSATTYAVANGISLQRGASTETNHDAWLQAAIEATRTDIGSVTGSGNILGVWSYSGAKYVFRNNAGGTEAKMYKSSSTGWTAVSLGSYLGFDSGSEEFTVGDEVEGVTSGATATVTAVVVKTGSFAGTDAAGRIYVSSVSGTFQDNEVIKNNTTTTADVADADGTVTAVTLQPGGRYEFRNYNFLGEADAAKMYGCDGVNPAFQFDGTTFVQIVIDMTNDTPQHLAAHKKHLFLSFPNGILQHSSIGDPLAWSVITGAAALGTGDDNVGMAITLGDVLAIWNRNSTYLLYGTSSADWNLKSLSDEAGAIEWTTQRFAGSPFYLDDRGITRLDAVEAYGDFQASSISSAIAPYLETKTSLVTASIRVREKNQYRLFFSDGYGVIVRLEGQQVYITRINYGKAVHCTCSAENSDGTEVLLFGSDDGYVYEMDAGTSFDGESVQSFVRLAYFFDGRPRQIKSFTKAELLIDSSRGTELNFTQEYSNSTPNIPRGITQEMTMNTGGGFWGADEWGEFLWGQQVQGTAEAYLDGEGTNIGVVIRSDSIYTQPHTLQGIIYEYIARGSAG
jgi:hypothetical protein